jgi:hypothetical protein
LPESLASGPETPLHPNPSFLKGRSALQQQQQKKKWFADLNQQFHSTFTRWSVE